MSVDEYLGYPNKRVAGQAALGAAIARGGSRFLRKRMPSSLRDLSDVAGILHGDSIRMLQDVPWLSRLVPAEAYPRLVNEFAGVQTELGQRYRERRLPFPSYWGVEEETSVLLYLLVRRLRPSLVIEVGVGNGHSSFIILRALRQNNEGVLYSFDIEPRAGGLVGEPEGAHWRFRPVTRRHAATSLARQVLKLPAAGLCFHDAGHSYLAQRFDFKLLWEQLASDGVLVCDDVDASYALIDFCRSTSVTPEVLIDGRKAVALAARS